MDYQKINKQNIYKWENALKYLTSTLSSNNIPYYLSASGLEYIQGSKKYPYDIDLFISKENIEQAFGLLQNFTTSDIHLWENKYLEFQGEYNGIPFEICEWEVEPKKLTDVTYEGSKISIIKT